MHKMNYEVIGQGGQEFIEVTLKPGEKVLSEPGAMIYMGGHVKYEAKMGDGSQPKSGFLDNLLSVSARVLSGEGLALVHYTNTHPSESQKVAFASPYPGAIVGIDLELVGGELIIQRGAYLASSLGTQITVATTGSVSSTLFGGEGLFMQKIIGSNTLILHAGGTIQQVDLKPGEELLVDEGCLVGYTQGISFEATLATRSIGTMIFGGEGLCLTKLTGTGQGGTVLLQNLPIERLGKSLSPYVQSSSNNDLSL